MRTDDFFAFARERHNVHLRRRAGAPWPWTPDPILQEFRFTNVFRELDKVTVWFRENVRDRLETHPMDEAIMATILFRTLNRIESCEVVFNQFNTITKDMIPAGWAYVRSEVDIKTVETLLRSAIPRGPWVTGSYIVKTPDGMDKLAGALWIVEQAMQRVGATLAELVPSGGPQASLQSLHAALVQYPYLGGFTAYEIVSDLRHTFYWRDAPDIMTWAHAGPGAKRGINRLLGKDKNAPLSQAQALACMHLLLSCSRDPDFWPLQKMPIRDRTEETAAWDHTGPDWPAWEMREVEHTLCEFDKYERVRLGEGKPRQKFRRPQC